MIRESSSPDKLTARRSLVQRLLSSEQSVLHRQIVLLGQEHQILVANEVLLVRREAVQVVLRERGSGRVLVHVSSFGLVCSNNYKYRRGLDRSQVPAVSSPALEVSRQYAARPDSRPRTPHPRSAG